MVPQISTSGPGQAGVAARRKEWLRRKAEPLELTIHQMQVMPDHVPLFVEGTPTIGVAEMVNRTEGIYLARIARAVSVSQVAIA